MNVTAEALATVRHDWTESRIREIRDQPLTELIFTAQTVHRRFHDPRKVQLCTLLNIKTGACPEDCGYCSQSGHHNARIEPRGLIDVDSVLDAARKAKESGSTRLCMGAAWRQPRDGREFEQVLEMVRGVRALELEACCTLGMLTADQARRLAEAGLTSYNHNLDTGPEYYSKIVTTHTFDDRLRTLRHVQEAGIEVCCGGIIGMGEELSDRVTLLAALAGLDPHPGSVPINALVAIAGTPLEDLPPVEPFDMVRMIATARIVLPRSRVRLSAGRLGMSEEAQALCFLAGANSIFAGETLLTTPNPSVDRDRALLEKLGLTVLEG